MIVFDHMTAEMREQYAIGAALKRALFVAFLRRWFR